MNLTVSNLTFTYGTKEILRDISFSVEEGCVLGLLGPNGTGKTTLLKATGGIHRPAAGLCALGRQDLLKLSPSKRARVAAYVPQSTHTPFPASVMDTVMTGRMPFIRFRPGKQDKQMVSDLLQRLEIGHLAFENVEHLSGGERQRVLTARALAQQPKLLLLDEPTSSLDPKNQLHTMSLVRNLAREQNLIAVVAIHDLNLAAMFCDRFLMLKDGSLYACGDGEQVFTPEHIRAVYGVESEIHLLGGYRHVVLLGETK